MTRKWKQAAFAICVLCAMIIFNTGCSSPNNQSSFNPDTGRHVAGWADPTMHGASAKSQADGFFSCQECHGSDYTGGIAAVKCSTCHGGNAPHPTSWITGTYTHTNTNTANASVCAQCHTGGANSPIAPPSPAAPSGMAPGCFNNTLCHAVAGHPSGWSNPAVHGASAKAAPNPATTSGFSTCQTCHGTNFAGGSANTACASCHGGSAPHPTSWITGTYTHTTTDTSNASVCALCHTNGANSPIAPPSPAASAGTAPGCFNSTLCHAAAGHPSGWSDPAVHGASAKAAPNPATTTGFSSCQPCHGTTFSGGIANIACYSCHGGSAPHPTSWITSTYTHTTTNTANATVCALCHTNGANSPIAPPSPPAPSGTAPGCFNNTLCHAQPACGTCHGIPPAGSVYPDIAGSHAPHMSANASIGCSTCHLGAGSGTALHQNGTVDVILDPTYNATSGAATYNAGSLTCSNIGCHGSSRTQNATQAASSTSTPGQTPVWGSGTIDVNSQCTLCHVLGSAAGNPENNSYYSGRHYLHVWDPSNGPQPKLACTVCHDTTILATVHFTSLTAPISEATASTTIRSSVNFNGTSCSPGCHGNQTW
jgi:predicted CxxxxCH...CXXCH cytochrome family protein